MIERMQRPEYTTDAQLDRLDALRAEGVNMFGVYGELMIEFGLTRDEAMVTLIYWIVTMERRGVKCYV